MPPCKINPLSVTSRRTVLVDIRACIEKVDMQISNTVGTAAPMVFQLPFHNVAASGRLEQLAGAQTASNTPEAPNTAAPLTSTITTGKTLKFTAPGFSVSVIRVKAS